jgi:hypothetical protein
MRVSSLLKLKRDKYIVYLKEWFIKEGDNEKES